MTPVDIQQGATFISNVDKMKDISITVTAIIITVSVILYVIKFYLDSVIAKKEAESMAKDNLLEAKINNIEEKVTSKSKEVTEQYNSFYKLLIDIKEKLISKDDLNNLIDVRISKHKDTCDYKK